MRVVSFLLITILIYSCKPKDKSQSLQNLFNKDSAKTEISDKKNLSTRELIIGKWKMQEVFPMPESEEEKMEMLNTIIEFTPDGKIMVTSKGTTKQEATFTLSMDNKYVLSIDTDKDNMDSLYIEDINVNRLVLTQPKDNTKIILAPAK